MSSVQNMASTQHQFLQDQAAENRICKDQFTFTNTIHTGLILAVNSSINASYLCHIPEVRRQHNIK